MTDTVAKPKNIAVDFFSEFAVNDQKVADGVWIPYRGDVKLLIASSANKAYLRLVRAEFGKHRRLLDAKDGNGNQTEEAEEKMKEITINAMSKAILLGWEGNVMYQGEVLEYSQENAKKLLQMKGFRDYVAELAADEQRYKAVQEEEEAKN